MSHPSLTSFRAPTSKAVLPRFRPHPAAPLGLLAIAAIAAGCGDETLGGPDDELAQGRERAAAASLPTLTELPAGTWSVLRPGGPTGCSLGTEFVFGVWPGREDRLVVNFIGGGACWDALTCGLQTFTPDVDGVVDILDEGRFPGIFDMTDPENPIGDYTHVVVPYCTGDVHWGENVERYTDDIRIRHIGAVNTRTVLAWVREQVDAPERVLTTGCSAGGYGASMWGAHVMNLYPGARHVLLADASAGVITDSFFVDSFPRWNATSAFPDFIPGFDADQVTAAPQYWNAFAGHFPNATFAQFTSVRDNNQVFFYDTMGGEGGAEGWSVRMRDNLARIADASPNFRYFVAGDDPDTPLPEDDVHCVRNPDPLYYDFDEGVELTEGGGSTFYELAENGVRFVDWLDGLLDAGETPDSIACDGCAPTRR